MVDNSTSPPPQGDAFAALGVNARTAFIILHVTALPLGVFFEFFLIMRLLKKTKKRLWDTLTMALEAIVSNPVASPFKSFILKALCCSFTSPPRFGSFDFHMNADHRLDEMSRA